ncbi:hypothetical protein QZH41_017670 [Actinostola sp. cb2023]|nr:hypothetical protein QZH41_017670 [Actinostola sp. cb2023]
MAATLMTKSTRVWSPQKIVKCIRMSSFQALGINEVLVNRLAKLGIKRPSEIQQKAITAVLEGRNTIINAETGSGKTLCYLLPIVNELINKPYLLTRPPHAIILLPTIELCHQVASVFKSIADPHMHPCIVHRDSKLLIGCSYPVVMTMPSSLLNYDLDTFSNVKVVITDEADFLTTSGGKDVWTLLDDLKLGKHRKKKRQNSKKTSTTFIQTNDNIPEKSNLKDSQSHLNLTSQRQFVFVAATLPSRGKKASLNVLTKWVPDAKVVTTSVVHQKLPTLDVEYVKVTEDTKLPKLLCQLNILVGLLECERKDIVNEKMDDNYDKMGWNGKVQEETATEDFVFERKERCLRVLVFANTAQQASLAFRYLTEEDDLEANKMQNANNEDNNGQQRLDNEDMIDTGSKSYFRGKCAALHKDVPIAKRLESLEQFKSGKLEVLVCTDIASRGLDIPDVSHVIQLDFASNAATVLHRTGRAARAGSRGKVINFITSKDEDLARALRACDEDVNNVDYEAMFSRNRMFRRRMKRNTLPLADSIQYRM